MEHYVNINLPLFQYVIEESEKYMNFVKIKIPMDGSCFFHAILMATSVTYNDEETIIRDENGYEIIVKIDRDKLVSNERKRLSKMLSSTIVNNPGSLTYYETLSRVYLSSDLSKQVPEIYSLKTMKANLKNINFFIGLEFLEFASLVYDIDIYIINDNTKDIYRTGESYDNFYENRNSIILLYLNENHFDLIGLWHNKGISTYFTHDNLFINALRKRYKLLH